MSATCQSKSSPTKATNIQIRRVLLSDPSQVPSDLSSTPGGTLFSTTPGGTRIVYDRAFLLECRNSPLANSPPVGLPQIPGVTCTISPGQHAKNGVSPSSLKQHGPGGLPHGPHHGGHGHGHGPHHGHAVHVTSPLTADALPKTSPPPTGSLAPSVEEPQFDMDM